MKKSTPIQFVFRILVYCVGLFILATGVAFSVNGNLGVSPVNSLPFVVSQAFFVMEKLRTKRGDRVELPSVSSSI